MALDMLQAGTLNIMLHIHDEIDREEYKRRHAEIQAQENLVRDGMVDRIRHGDSGDSGDYRLRVRDIPYSI